MKTFSIVLASPRMSERISDVASVTARDPSGSFGVLATACRRLTALSYGLMTIRMADTTVEYVAAAGGVFIFADNELRIATTNYIRTRDFQEIPEILDSRLKREEENIQEIKESLHNLDEEMLKRVARMGRSPFQ